MSLGELSVQSCGGLQNYSYLCRKIGTIIKTTEVMTVIISIVALVVIALIGWGIAEGKSKMNYVNNDEEKAVLQRNEEQLRQNGYTELNIKDVIRTIATTGYSAV